MSGTTRKEFLIGLAAASLATPRMGGASPLQSTALPSVESVQGILDQTLANIRSLDLTASTTVDELDPTFASLEKGQLRVDLFASALRECFTSSGYLRIYSKPAAELIYAGFEGDCILKEVAGTSKPKTRVFYQGPCNSEHPWKDVRKAYFPTPERNLLSIDGGLSSLADQQVVLVQGEKRYWVSLDRGLVFRVQVFKEGPGLAGEVLYSDYRNVGGVLFPMSRIETEYGSQGQVLIKSTRHVENVSLNNDIPDSLFQGYFE